MIQPKPLKHRRDNNCPDCQTLRGRFNSFGQFYCETCDSLYEINNTNVIKKCYYCQGLGKTVKTSIRQVCCEKPLELGLCCQTYILDLEEIKFKCTKCDGTGTRPQGKTSEQE